MNASVHIPRGKQKIYQVFLSWLYLQIAP
jgi:hypothetical protein